MSGTLESASCSHSSNASMLPAMYSSGSGTVLLHSAHPAGITGDRDTLVPLSLKKRYISACFEAVSLEMVALTEYLFSLDESMETAFSGSSCLRTPFHGPSQDTPTLIAFSLQ